MFELDLTVSISFPTFGVIYFLSTKKMQYSYNPSSELGLNARARLNVLWLSDYS